MRYIDLFAGIGGFRLGIQRGLGTQQADEGSEQTKQEARSVRGKRPTLEKESGVYPNTLRVGRPVCVYSNEWDKYAAQTYEKNFGERPDTRSITDVSTTEIPDHDLLVGGFPCQAFSIAGKRQGFNDTRGTLFFDIARILKDKRPRHFILENVKGLLSHDSGKTFQTILRVLSDLGYEYQWQVLNSKNFGVPQNRERVFIVGHIRGEPRPKVFPITGQGKQAVGAGELAGTLQADYFKGDRTGGYAIEAKRYPLKFTKRNQKNIEGDYSFTVDGANTGGVRQDMKIRRLTPLECERLQGFPDNWTEGVSDTQRYKQLGNAVTVNVVEYVVRRLYE